jgi:photosystem II stability/assembly factor-like uncharacterized protein
MASESMWQLPACENIKGTGAVTFTRDDGKRLAPTTEVLRPVSYTMGLVALDTPNTLLAAVNETLIRSTDAGCHWDTIGAVNSGLPKLTEAAGGRAYGWTEEGHTLFGVDQTEITNLPSPVTSIAGLGVDPKDPHHLRIASHNGTIHDSEDAGRTWLTMGVSPITGDHSVYRTAFDPNNLDHILVGSGGAGAFVSFDGGMTWRSSKGFGRVGEAINIFNIVISPAQSQVVWAMGLNLAESDAGHDLSAGRHIYLSSDGGCNFIPVVNDNRPTVTLINGPVMSAHQKDPNILYFVFGMSFGNYGTDLFKYEAETKKLTKTHNNYDRVTAIAFSPADSSVLYLGLAKERPTDAATPAAVGGDR